MLYYTKEHPSSFQDWNIIKPHARNQANRFHRQLRQSPQIDTSRPSSQTNRDLPEARSIMKHNMYAKRYQ